MEEFGTAILQSNSVLYEDSTTNAGQGSYFLQSPAFKSRARSPVSESSTDKQQIANIIIAKNLNKASKQVQIQALELIRTKHVLTRTSLHNAPKRFLLVAAVASGHEVRLTKHLNDHVFISHFHDVEDGFPNLEDQDDDNLESSALFHAVVSTYTDSLKYILISKGS